MHLAATRSFTWLLHSSRGNVNRCASTTSVPIAASESTLGLLQAIRGPDTKSEDGGNVGIVLSASGGLARVSFPGPVSVGSSISFGADLRGMVLQFDRKGAIVAPLSARMPKAGAQASIEGVLSVQAPLPELATCGATFASVAEVLHTYDATDNTTDGILRLPPMPPPPRRRPVTQRLPSGLATAEALLPLGHGQRVGLVGPEGTGKSTAARMLLASQEEDTVCIYAAQRPLDRLQREFQDFGSSPLMVLYADPMRDALLNRYLVPICALQLAAQLRALHRRVVVVLDDLVAFAAAAAELEIVVGSGARGPLPLSVSHVLGSALDAAGSLTMGSTHEHALSVLPVLDLEPDDELPSAMRGLWYGVEPSLDVCLRFSAEVAMSGIFPAIDPKALLPCGFGPTFQAPLLRLLRSELRVAFQKGYELEDRMRLSKQLGIESELDEEEDLVSSATARALLSHSSARSLPELVVLLCAAVVYRLPVKRPSRTALARFQHAIIDVIRNQHPALWSSLQSLDLSTEGDARIILRDLGETLIMHRFDFELLRAGL